MRVALRHLAVLSFISFFLNLVWEYGQCELFFTHGSLKPTHQAMIIATLGDVAITWLIYTALALWRRNWFWSMHSWRKLDVMILLMLAIVIGSAIELRALSVGKWSYSPNSPLVPGTPISIIPLLQLILLVPISIKISKVFQ